MQDLHFRINAPQLLKEIAESGLVNNAGVLFIPLNIFRNSLALIGQRCAEINDPILNKICFDMNLFELPSPQSKEYGKIMEQVYLEEKEYLKNNTMKTISKEEALNKHNQLRDIIESYGNQEYGDCIIDEITALFDYPTTLEADPEEEEMRVYVVDRYIGREDPVDTSSWSDGEFMREAEKQGNVYTLKGFEGAYSKGDIDRGNDDIRFISVPLF